MSLDAKECKKEHKDDWDYVSETEYWCPECKRIRVARK